MSARWTDEDLQKMARRLGQMQGLIAMRVEGIERGIGPKLTDLGEPGLELAEKIAQAIAAAPPARTTKPTPTPLRLVWSRD